MEMIRGSFVTGFIIAILCMGCAGFSYKYYGMNGMDYSKGKLLGPDEKQDLDFYVCAPSPAVKNPCVIMKATEFFKMKQEHEDMRERLKTCESQ